ncbi:MAG: DUF6273 domain-containing protein [Clostridiales bacterium]|nr:DUF6273 domain-containing protein [Clostridiales bacterium]
MKEFKKVLSTVLCLIMLFGIVAVGGDGFADLFEAISVKASASYSVGDIIFYGNYPQSEVKDADLIAKLNAQEGTWKSYGYYSGTGNMYDGQMTASDYMRYKDVAYNGHKYRAVTFDSYRPCYTGYTSSADNAYQDDRGYTTGNVYWFKYDPLKWRVLDSTTGLVMCDSIIDSQPYNNYFLKSGKDSRGYNAFWGDSSKTYYANNYAKSSIRQWLNNDFYNTAFSSSQKSNIKTTALDNDSAYTLHVGSGYEEFNAPSTNDKIFLLSYDEVQEEKFGFNSDEERIAFGSDYALSQGLLYYAKYYDEEDIYYYISPWRLRSPGNSRGTCCVSPNGGVDWDNLCGTYDTSYGVRPALCLQNLKSDTAGSDIEEPGLFETGITLEQEKYKTTLGDSFDIKVTNLSLPAHEAGELIWESSDQSVSIVSHDKYATVTAEKPGYSVITVSSHGGGYSAQCIVFVGDRSLVIGKQSGFLEVGKEQGYMLSLCNADFVNMSDNKTVSIDQAYASSEEISEISFVIADQSVATITSTSIDKGVIEIKVKGIKEGITYFTVTYNETGEVRYFPICVTNSENTYYINSIPAKKYDDDKVYNFYQSGIYIYNFKAESGGEDYSNISFDAHNTTGIIGSVDIYDENGNLVRNEMIKSFDFQPTDPIKGLKTLYYLVPAICTLSYNDITKPFNSSKTSISFKLPQNGYFKINNDISASTPCLIYNTVNLTIDSISKFSGLKSTLSSKQKEEAEKEIAEQILDYILKATGLGSESGAFLKTLSKLKDEMLKDAERFNMKSIYSIMDELCTHLKLNIDYVELAKSTLVNILKSTANNVLLSLDKTGIAKLLYKYQGWENYCTTLTDLNLHNGDGSSFVYNIQGGTKRISNGIMFEGSAEDVTIFRTYEVSYGDVVDSLNKEFTKAKLYDISMVKNNELTQPNATAKILIPIPFGYNKTGLKVYRINDNGSKTDMNARIEKNYLVFETDHFSYYAVVESNPTSSSKLKIPSNTTVEYSSKVTIKATATDVPSGYYVALYDGSTLLEKGSNTEVSYTFPGEFKSEKNLTVKIIDGSGNVQKDGNGKDLTASFTVKAKTGFFAKLIAFFRRLFGSLPAVTVEPK